MKWMNEANDGNYTQMDKWRHLSICVQELKHKCQTYAFE